MRLLFQVPAPKSERPELRSGQRRSRKTERNQALSNTIPGRDVPRSGQFAVLSCSSSRPPAETALAGGLVTPGRGQLAEQREPVGQHADGRTICSAERHAAGAL